MKIEQRALSVTFALPCPKVEGTICTIYEQRPAACAGYKCALLKRYVAGNISLDSALAVVEETRQRLAALEKELPAGVALSGFRREWRVRMAGAAMAQSTDGERPRSGEAYLQLAMLNLYVDRYFRLAREKFFLSEKEKEADPLPPP